METEGKEEKRMAPPLQDLFRASYLAQRANHLASNAYLGAIHCDAEKARRLAAQATPLVQQARQLINNAPQAARDFYATDDVTLRLLDAVQDNLKKIDGLLSQCRDDPRHPYLDGGSFSGSRGELDGRERKNKIEFVFVLNGEVECRDLCMVSVFHIENDETGETVIPPSNGYRPGFDPVFYGGAPQDSDSVRGYVVDAPPRILKKMKFVNNTRPCMPSMKIDGNRVTAEDEPAFVKPGHTAYFETCLLCMDGEHFRVLGSMRWLHRTGLSKIMPGPDGKTDWGPSSRMFREAVRRWLQNHR
jgi:hypothetical protein